MTSSSGVWHGHQGQCLHLTSPGTLAQYHLARPSFTLAFYCFHDLEESWPDCIFRHQFTKVIYCINTTCSAKTLHRPCLQRGQQTTQATPTRTGAIKAMGRASVAPTTDNHLNRTTLTLIRWSGRRTLTSSSGTQHINHV